MQSLQIKLTVKQRDHSIRYQKKKHLFKETLCFGYNRDKNSGSSSLPPRGGDPLKAQLSRERGGIKSSEAASI
jgi:hypothetical protein